MSVTFQVHSCHHDADRKEIQVEGRMDDGILVTGMLARAANRVSSVQEIEMLPDGLSGTLFRLTFSAASEQDPSAWVRDWSAAPELTLEY
jgi:hypothetical protein